MRLLHTSDWHIGRSLHGTDLLAEQEAGAGRPGRRGGRRGGRRRGRRRRRLRPRGARRPTPPRCSAGSSPGCRRAGATVVLTPGNHDSARRLGTFSELLAAGGLHVRAETPRLDEPVLLADEHGDVAVYGLPYLEPEVARFELGADRRRAATRPCSPRRWTGCAPTCSCGPASARWCSRTPSSAAGVASESERDISVGGVDLVPAAVFDGVDYVALGHLHRPQTLTPAAALQRLAAGLLLRRGRPAEAGLAGRARRRRPRRRPRRAAADPARS